MAKYRAKPWLIAVAVVLVAGVGAGTVVALTFDPNGQKDRIIEAVRRATGRDLSLNGPVHLQWGLSPALEAEDVSFANMAGGTRPQMVTASRVEARLLLMPLLTGRVELASVTLVRPDILLETDASGRGNWQFAREPAVPAASPAPAAAPSSAPRFTTVLDSVRVEAGRVTWHDGRTGRTTVMDVPQATLDLGTGPAHLSALAQTAGVDLRMTATLGTRDQLVGQAAFPVSLALSVDSAAVKVDGTLDPAARSFSGRVVAAIPDLARFGTVLQRPLPPLRDVQVAATLPGGLGLPHDITVHVGASDLGSVVPGLALTAMDFNWPMAQAARLDVSGTVAGAPWHVASGLVAAGRGVALRGFSLTSGAGDAAGDLAAGLSPRPFLRGTLVSARMDVDAMRALMRPAPVAVSAPAKPAPASPAPAPTGTPAQPRLFSDTLLPWGMLRRADADLQLSIATLHAGGADYHDATGHVVLQDGVLRIDPASVRSPEGQVDFSASADARQAAPPVTLALRSGAFAIDPLLQAFGLPGGSDASAELDVALHAAGQTPHALAASLDGHVGLAMVDAEVSNAVLTQALGEAVRSAGVGLDPGGRSHVRCLAIRADAQAGQVTISALKLDTQRLLLDGSGTLNLVDETMDLRLRPLVRLGGTSVLAGVRLTGAIRHPAVAMDSPGASGRAGVVIGAAAGTADQCGPQLTAARDGRAGRMPVDAPLKPMKPADLLRSFLR